MTTTTIDIRLPRLHDLQQLIADHPARYKNLCIGRRGGKTALAKDLLVNAALDGKPVAYFAPTYKMLRAVWDEVNTIVQPVIQRRDAQEKRLQLLTGGIIDFWSLDSADTVRGRAYALVIIDEAAMIPRLEYAWTEVIRPTLTDYQGRAVFLSTPKGRNYFWQLYQRGLDPLEKDWQSWQSPTSANPFILAGEIEAARLELPERAFRQEYLAEFLEDSGIVFRGVTDVAIHPPALPEHGHSYVMGVDWAKSEDFTVLVVIDETTRRMVAMDRFNQVSWALQRGRLMETYRQYKPRLILAEANSIGEPNIEALRDERLPVEGFQTTASSKGPLIDGLALAIERQELGLLDDPVLVGELQGYEMKRTPSGMWQYSAPDGGHDDTVIATALALRAMQTGPAIGRARTNSIYGGW